MISFTFIIIYSFTLYHGPITISGKFPFHHLFVYFVPWSFLLYRGSSILLCLASNNLLEQRGHYATNDWPYSEQGVPARVNRFRESFAYVPITRTCETASSALQQRRPSIRIYNIYVYTYLTSVVISGSEILFIMMRSALESLKQPLKDRFTVFPGYWYKLSA